MTKLSLANHPSVPPLKKLWNRDYGAQRLTAELDRAQHENNYQFAVVLVQLDGLSNITNRLGYATHDNIWPNILGFLTRDLEPQDICCRMGGDEFLLILPATGDARARNLAQDLRGAWRPEPESRESSIDIGVGFASSLADGSTIEALFAAADRALDDERQRNRLLRVAKTSVADGSHFDEPARVVEGRS